MGKYKKLKKQCKLLALQLQKLDLQQQINDVRQKPDPFGFYAAKKGHKP